MRWAQGMTELSERERQVLTLLSRGWRIGEIASCLFVSKSTVKVYAYRAQEKMDAETLIEAAVRASALGYIPCDERETA